MKNTTVQENEPRTRQLVALLNTVQPPEKSAQEWIVFENRLFAELDDLQRKRVRDAFIIPGIASFFWFLRKPLPIAVLSLLLALGTATFIIMMKRPNETVVTASEKALLNVKKGDVFATNASDGLFAGLTPNTGFYLYKNSLARIQASEAGNTIVRIDSGEAVFTVAKLNAQQKFCVLTPNAECVIVGTKFSVAVNKKNGTSFPSTELTVLSGIVEIRSLVSPVTSEQVEGGSAVLVCGTTIKKYPAQSAMARLSEIVWNLQGSLGLAQTSGPFPLPSETAPAMQPVPTAPQKPLAQGQIQIPVPLQTESSAQPILPVFISREALLENPEYLMACNDIKNGNYSNALKTLQALDDRTDITRAAGDEILEKISLCYRGMGDFASVVTVLRYVEKNTANMVKKDNVLWETALIEASNLKNYTHAEKDLKQYISQYKNGLWIHEAYIKLAEIQYLMKNPQAAVETYSEYIDRFPGNPIIDKAIYNMAYLMGSELYDCKAAIKCYEQLQQSFPESRFLENSIFWQADCLNRLGQFNEARKEYQRYIQLFPEGRWSPAARERLAGIGQ
ncbi:MAG: hypothetical protein A2487_01175 [Candidatus Raymondbacteria bacterium RifOxyC12_full_50_8]|uniref:Uncharacterized protein n=1 Tax=Candidatus Raymondbacteria bacterium RIFOXYD12_FULL_49_13 TaxID=1817890 RepID=A0A1F7F986_UNCRA|nr:MAG: hypothetical protein A2248_09755 [Candidatus Raymondbacteria bacterium RIFOXYA2_FULL_49_16]OGJ91847.1 MAG: hypothetical protein A2350_21475 [Candidatus Raymondbacteria bacterium RifOxyB12_full_50_8]OGJ95494.1 MAG: hypothetical protein A2487_01175 [Candidatus Raymondbacteria bacterium RifOxyC12_full_50_8]OGJ97188.1 MAG: hypothetical protein A2453_10400 [Candidatus Raymondbacteria bacterium RIFOXYC2_FULL_50_21]OGK03215.1 MAG: hypothetical protein A2519_05150 [Candidatus Raymondbacteria ba